MIGGIEDILSPTADDRFTSKTLRVGSQEGERIRTIQFIGRSSVDGSNSVYYDNITLTAVPSANDKLTKPNPYLAENIANSIVEQILKQSLEGGGVHLLDELAGRGKAWRDAAAAAGNAIHDGINEAIHADITKAFKKAAIDTILFSAGTFGAGTALKVAVNTYGLTSNVVDIAKAKGKSQLDVDDVLLPAGVKEFGDSIVPGLGGNLLLNLTSQTSNSPERSAESNKFRSSPRSGEPFKTKLSIANKAKQSTKSKKIQGSRKNDKISGTLEDNYLFGKAGNDTLRGQQGWDILIGDAGNDRLIGGQGADVLNGSSKKFIAGEVDRLTGGTGVDIFVLGNPERHYYDDKNRRTAGKKDYALITDFNPNHDFIVLKGKFSDYIFKQDKIFLNDDGLRRFSRNDELIAKVKGAINLSLVDIMFV